MHIRLYKIAVAVVVTLVALAPPVAAQTTSINAEYLMTYRGELAAPYKIDDSLMIFNVRSPGGWARGPKINGTFIPPGGDWMHILPSGALRLDVRATLKTDDGALIYISYNGVMQVEPDTMKKMMSGAVMTSKDIPSFITAPTFETSSPKYAWLNGVQAINKVVELKVGEDGYVQYDVFIIR
jgi:hypothetical protein